MPIRVLHVIDNLHGGGAQVALRYLVENADIQNVVPFVYPLRQENIDITVAGKVIKFSYCNYDPRKFSAIVKLCRTHRIDIIHAHLEKAIILSLLVSFFCKVKVVVHEHGPVFLKGFECYVYRLILRFLRHRAAIFIACSHFTAVQLVEKARISLKKIRVIYNPVDFSKFSSVRFSRAEIRLSLNINSEDIVVGFVGRLSDYKGVDILIKATALILERNPNYLLVLVGDGPRYKALLKLTRQLGIAERVRFLGFRDNVSEIMDAFDIAVIPSRQEAFPLVFVEFMRKKIPLVCSGAGGMAEFAKNEETALVTSKNTPEQVSDSIERLTADSALQKKITENAYYYSEKFSLSNFVRSVQEVYCEILNYKKL